METKKIKIVIFIFTGLVLLSVTAFSLAESGTKNVFLDSDQDGLSNEEEKVYGTNPNKKDTDSDGYSDGAEVQSGYDPLKPAPGDKLTTVSKAAPAATEGTEVAEENQDQNLTEDLSTKLAGLLQNNATNGEAITTESLDTLLTESINKQVALDDLPEIDASQIKILKQNYAGLSEAERASKEKEDTMKYLTAAAYILANNSPQKMSETDDISLISNELISKISSFSSGSFDQQYFQTLSGKGKLVADQLLQVEVPESLADIHTQGIQVAYYLSTAGARFNSEESDPVNNLVNLANFRNAFSLNSEFSGLVIQKLLTLGVSEIPVDL